MDCTRGCWFRHRECERKRLPSCGAAFAAGTQNITGTVKVALGRVDRSGSGMRYRRNGCRTDRVVHPCCRGGMPGSELEYWERMKKRVAIVGYSFRFPGTDPDSFWQSLRDGRIWSSQVPEDRWSQDAYLHPRKSEPGTKLHVRRWVRSVMFPASMQHFSVFRHVRPSRWTRSSACRWSDWEAFERGGIRPSSVRGSRGAVYLGFSGSRLFLPAGRRPGVAGCIDDDRQYRQYCGQPYLVSVRSAWAEHGGRHPHVPRRWWRSIRRINRFATGNRRSPWWAGCHCICTHLPLLDLLRLRCCRGEVSATSLTRRVTATCARRRGCIYSQRVG